MTAPAASQVAERRAAAPHTSMFVRMLWRAAEVAGRSTRFNGGSRR